MTRTKVVHCACFATVEAVIEADEFLRGEMALFNESDGLHCASRSCWCFSSRTPRFLFGCLRGVAANGSSKKEKELKGVVF